jgi:hypothetical protein
MTDESRASKISNLNLNKDTYGVEAAERQRKEI